MYPWLPWCPHTLGSHGAHIPLAPIVPTHLFQGQVLPLQVQASVLKLAQLLPHLLSQALLQGPEHLEQVFRAPWRLPLCGRHGAATVCSAIGHTPAN